MQPSRSLTLPLGVIAAVLAAAALKFGAAFLAPTVLALIAGVILAPAISLLLRFGMPRSAAAGTVLAAALGGLAMLALVLEPVIWRAIARLPTVWYEVQETLRQFQDALRGLNEVSEDVAKAINPEGASNGSAAEGGMELPSAIDALALAPAIAAQIMIFTGVLFFFLFTRDSVYSWGALVLSGNDPATHQRYRASLLAAEHMVSRYFITVTIINACLGLAVAAGMIAIGMPSPMLWGIAAFAVNFIPYLGPAIYATILLLAGIVTFDGLMSFAPMGIYLCMNITEGQFVTPSLVGRAVNVNPLLLFLSLVFFLFIWGPVGGFVAIPVVIWVMLVTGMLDVAPENKELILERLKLEDEADRNREADDAEA